MHFALQGETGQEGPSGPRVSRGHVHSVRFVTDTENEQVTWFVYRVVYQKECNINLIDCSPITQQGPPGPTGEPGKTLINNNENVCLYVLCIQMLLYL